MLEIETLIELLVEKGIITKDELMGKMERYLFYSLKHISVFVGQDFPESLLGSLIQEVPSLERMERMRWAATFLATIGPHTSPPDSVPSVSSVTCNWEVCLYLSGSSFL